jgi:hypothetical protein
MDIQDRAFKEWFAQYDNNIEYASEKIAWDAWKEAKAQADQKIKLLLCDEHLKKCESPTGVFNSQYPDEEPCLICLAKEAKANAVPDLSELQERIAGHQYYHDEHGHMVVDMGDVVKEISGFDSWKAQAVPEGFVLVPKNPTHKMMEASWASLDAGSADEWWDVYEEVMKASQEPAND